MNTQIRKKVLVRDNQVCVLQGVIHVGPAGLYKHLRREMLDYMNNGYRLIIESVDTQIPLPSDSTRSQRLVYDFLKLTLAFYDPLAKAQGLARQKKDMEYPKDFLVADASLLEIAKRIESDCNVSCLLLFILLEVLQSDWVRQGYKDRESQEKHKRLNTNPSKIGSWFIKQTWGKMNSVLIGYRNEQAHSFIEHYFSLNGSEKVLVHYGDGHLEGLESLFLSSGWYCSEETVLLTHPAAWEDKSCQE